MEFGNPIVGLEELIRSAIRSKDFESGVTGWRIARDGSAEFSVIIIRGTGTGDIVVIGSDSSPQVKIGTLANAGFISFPTNSGIEGTSARILSARVNSGAVDEYGSMQIDGPSVTGAGATDRIQMQLNSQDNDAGSNANWSVRSVTNGFLIIADKDVVTTGTALRAIGGVTADTTVWTTYTPVISNGGTATYTSRTGWHYKFGDVRFFQAEFVVNAAGSGAGLITVSLPSTPYRNGGNDRQAVGTVHAKGMWTAGMAADGTAVVMDTGSGAVIDQLSMSNDNALNRDGILAGANLLAGSRCTIQGWYRE